jgi:hypothetical protein
VDGKVERDRLTRAASGATNEVCRGGVGHDVEVGAAVQNERVAVGDVGIHVGIVATRHERDAVGGKKVGGPST